MPATTGMPGRRSSRVIANETEGCDTFSDFAAKVTLPRSAAVAK